MPQLIEHIDAMARKKNRDVLFICFDAEQLGSFRYKDWSVRQQLLEWLDQHHITYFPCMGIAQENSWQSYLGQLYIDVPYNLDDPTYQMLQAHLEDDQGHMKIEGVLFHYLPLEIAKLNQQDDVEDYWD